MSEGSITEDASRALSHPLNPVSRRPPWLFGLFLITFVGACLRIAPIGRTSLWYDEVVTMRLARTPTPHALVRLLGEIDATRAPLHPLLLQRWLAVFGPSDTSGRAFSVLCGIVTIGLVFWVGSLAFGRQTGIWAAWLASVSPLLVYYSVEGRMYAWLVMATCLSWGAVFSFRRCDAWLPRVLYPLTLVGLCYSHPLGLLMSAALALASLTDRASFRLSLRYWAFSHALAFLAVLPWLPRYLDHPPEATSGRLPLTFLLGFPIGFIGGNFVVLFACVVMMIVSLVRSLRDSDPGTLERRDELAAFRALLIWLLVPSVVLYLYSRISHPIFGPARYTVFVAPAFLILLARGLTGLRRWPRLAAGAVLTALACVMSWGLLYPNDRKADWRSAAAYLDRHDPTAPVLVVSADPIHNAEVETARYYVGTRHLVVAYPDDLHRVPADFTSFWLAVGLRDGRAVGPAADAYSAEGRVLEVRDFPGLRLQRIALRGAEPKG